MNDREKLKREIYLLGETIEANAQTLASKTMYLDDREALKRQMAIRIGHHRQLQRRLGRLSPGQTIGPDIGADEQPFDRRRHCNLNEAAGTPPVQRFS